MPPSPLEGAVITVVGMVGFVIAIAAFAALKLGRAQRVRRSILFAAGLLGALAYALCVGDIAIHIAQTIATKF
jgi:hypothetical protein